MVLIAVNVPGTVVLKVSGCFVFDLSASFSTSGASFST